MQQDDQGTPVGKLDIGLDRSVVNSDGQIELPKLDSPNDNDDVLRQEVRPTESLSTHTSTHSRFNAINERRHEAAIKIRKTLHISKDSDHRSPESPVLANSIVKESYSRLVNGPPEPEKNILKDLAHNPVDTVKSKVSKQGNHQVAANIAAKEISHGNEVDLVNAHTAVQQAKTDEEKLDATKDLHQLMAARQSMFVRWTLDRHVTKVRILIRDTLVRKPRTEFHRKNVEGQAVLDWKAYGQNATIYFMELVYYAQQYGGQYIGCGSDPPSPSKETILPNIERLIVASAPLQELILAIRRVYRWQDPAETATYLFIYAALWYLNLLIPGVITVAMYFVIKRHAGGDTLDDLRKDIKQREDVHRNAVSLTEYIEKEGDEKWADDLLEALGPWVMIQLHDLANFFETARNFYEWRVPRRTYVTLAIFAIATIATALTPTWLLVKSITLGAGFAFFGLFPIATNFPDYRLLVSPSKLMLWNIPTHAEWAIKYIQAEGSRYEHLSPPLPTPTSPMQVPASRSGSQDYGSYTTHFEGNKGHLVISTSAVRFVSRDRQNIHWTVPYDEISDLEKRDRIVAKSIPKVKTDSGKDLRLRSKAGTVWLLENVDKRDEAFSQILGFSTSTWQVIW